MMVEDKRHKVNYETVIEKREPPKKNKEYLKFKENECKKKNNRIIFQKKAQQIHEEFRAQNKFRDRDWMKEQFLYMNEYDILKTETPLKKAVDME